MPVLRAPQPGESTTLTIKTPTDIHQLPLNHSLYIPAKILVERLIIPYHHPDKPYRADDEGFIVICEDGDQDVPQTVRTSSRAEGPKDSV